ncbi:MAG TPA: tetratricopeptide repeat protein [Terriglobales bacterium]|nr:tetratricopeptide repeat protein [Terriglobales bacterium]
MLRLGAILILVAALTTGAIAQRRNESLCDLNIRVRTTNERNYDTPVQVELLSQQGIPVSVRFTSGAGAADFMVASGNIYRVRVSGNDIETFTSGDIEILPREEAHMETVNVTMRKSSNEQTVANGAAPTVSLSEMNVPPKARAELQKGADALNKGDMKKAQQQFEKATVVYPQYARAYVDLGVVAIREGDRARAKECFAKAVQVDDKFLPGYVDLARMDYQDHNYSEAESLLQKVMALNPSMPDAVSLLATVEFMNKEYDKALVDAQRTHTLPGHEEFADVHLIAGKVLEMQGHAQEAIAEYQLFLKENPNSPRVAMVRQEVAQIEAGKH